MLCWCVCVVSAWFVLQCGGVGFFVVVVESVCDLYCRDEMYFVFMK